MRVVSSLGLPYTYYTLPLKSIRICSCAIAGRNIGVVFKGDHRADCVAVIGADSSHICYLVIASGKPQD